MARNSLQMAGTHADMLVVPILSSTMGCAEEGMKCHMIHPQMSSMNLS